MKKNTLKALKTILPLALGIFLVWYSIQSASPAEREMLWENITQANPLWIFLSLFCGLLSHLSRAYRWNFLLAPLGYKLKFSNSFMAVMVAYLANMGIPRSGEVLRGATATTYEDIPFEKSFGTIITERIIDLCMLLLIVGITALFQTDNLLHYFDSHGINPFTSVLFLGILLLLGILFLRLIRRSSNPFLRKIRDFGSGILEGVRSIFHLKRKKAFFMHTLFIWSMYVLMFYVMKFALPETSTLGIGAMLMAFVVGSFAVSLTNGGIGIYPIAIGAILLWFGIDKHAGEAFGWIVWGAQTLMNIILGGLSFFFLPIVNRK